LDGYHYSYKSNPKKTKNQFTEKETKEEEEGKPIITTIYKKRIYAKD